MSEKTQRIVEALNQKMAIDDGKNQVTFQIGSGGFVEVNLSTEQAKCAMYTYGAHISSLSLAGNEVLWVSGESHFEAGRPIRGGIPICFPWFAQNTLDHAPAESPMHGFARTSNWKIRDTQRLIHDGVQISFVLDWTPKTKPLFNGTFEAIYTVTLTHELTLSLEVINHGKEAFTFEEALHSYFNISDIDGTRIEGLEGATYIDKVDGFKEKQQEGPVTFNSETDRVYSSKKECRIYDPDLDHLIKVDKTGSATTVVWNPWLEKSRNMGDFGDAEWQGMLCLETANAGKNRITLASGQSHEMTCRIYV